MCGRIYITNAHTMWHEDDQDPEIPFMDGEDDDDTDDDSEEDEEAEEDSEEESY